ncbi:MAG TPA: DUF4190 domain-containing protein [Pyrinomonadaceae bacterium]|nr:DUF4190 domain-containing protein [Pyrinomonadaceae bacterium]
MKQCPRCNQTYSDDQLNFCLNDGELLTNYASEPSPSRYADDSPPTIILDSARVTNPASWPAGAQPPAQWQPQNVQNQPFGTSFVQKRDQVLPTIAMILGILSIALICCYGGIWLGLPAAVLGFLGMRNADSDPGRYGGRGMAIAGMVLGVVSLLSSLVVALIAIIAR